MMIGAYRYSGGYSVGGFEIQRLWVPPKSNRGALDSAKNQKRQRRKRQSVTAKREKSQTPKFV